ncbi:MAG: hypothetical protein ACRC0X_03345 [Brevinema sp.]
MHITILSVLILFFSYTYTQDQSNTVEIRIPVNRGEPRTSQNRLARSNTSQNRTVRNNTSQNSTFCTYEIKTNISSDVAEWRDRYQKAQEQYRVSLVGVNINSWLENPEYFNTLIDQAKKFPVSALLDNLQSYNPTLLFNDPSLVSRVLNEDIYSSHLSVISNYQEKTLRFTDFKTVISYTRRYHIYGAAAGDLPYFGRPVEGGSREINLSTINGQIMEIATKLPDTDIFLVAMINIVPNWLEEGWDIFQVSQQELEILVYAFDRHGKLLGGAGVPMNFLFNGKHFTMEQKIYSKIWQGGTSRRFYAWPSFQISNSKDRSKEKITPQISLPPNKLPSLNAEQKYILEALNSLRENKENLYTELFDAEGRKMLKVKPVKDNKKIILANRILQHKESTLLVLEKPLEQMPLLVRLNEISQGQVAFKQEYYPSNEGEKIISLLTYGVESLRTIPFTHTNKIHYTNEIADYELELDPIDYKRGQKKYAVIPHNIKEYTKNFRKDTKVLVKQKKLELKDRLFWNDFRDSLLETALKNFDMETELLIRQKELEFQDRLFWNDLRDSLLENNFSNDKAQNLYYKDLKRAYSDWKKIYQDYMAISIKKMRIERQEDLYVQLENDLPILKERNIDLIIDRYATNPKKITNKTENIEAKVLKVEEKVQQRINNEKRKEALVSVQEEFDRIALEEKEKYAVFTSLIPKTFDCSTEFPEIIITDQEMRAQSNNIDPKLIAVGLAMGKSSPLDKVATKNIRKEQKKEVRNTKSLYYEGFMLGLTRAWTTKTKLEDRLERF